MKVSVEKPGSPADILEHHGVKGMRWGHRSLATKQASDKFNRRNTTSQQRSDAIRRARAGNIKRATDFRTERDPIKRANLKQTFLNHPDRATALRMTRGEKLVLGLIAVGIPGPGTVGVAIGVGAQVGLRKAIEKKQQR